jgi:predicted ATPase/DNA-binding CsgD family transcriptional regulator
VLDQKAGNLPAQLSSFVGRDVELAELKALLSQVRLLTLTGVGGCGKTRLGIQLATAARDRFPDGVWFVDLASVVASAQVPFAMASALKVADKPGQSLEENLWNQLAPSRLLIVLDNCEHLIESSAQLAAAAIASCPGVVIIATSREALNIPGELSWRVPPLRPADASRLFLERAALIRTGRGVTGLRKQQVADLCRRLDGLPLALELAAVRLRVMPLEEIIARLEDRFRLLSTGSRTALPRQQTLRATVDWSYELLTEPERALFRRLSVFVGGFDLAAVEAICGEAVNVLEQLPQLVERSMVQAEETAGPGARYRMLETLRQYGTEQLLASGEVPKVGRRHAEYFLELAESGQALGAGQEANLQRLHVDYANLRAALDWFGVNDSSGQLRLAAAMGWFWTSGVQVQDGRHYLEAALASSPDRSAVRSKALQWLGHLVRSHGDVALGRSYLVEALAITEELNDESGQAFTHLMLGTTSAVLGDQVAARGHYEGARAMYERLGDRPGVARMQFYLGFGDYFQGDLPRAEALLKDSLPILRQAKDATFTSQALMALGLVMVDVGQLTQARTLFVEALSIAHRSSNQFAINLTLEGLAGLAAAQQQHQRALHLAGAASAARDATGMRPLPAHFHPRLYSWLAPARRRVGTKAASEAWELGRKLSLPEAMAYATGEAGKMPVTGPSAVLTRRELEIAELVSQGLTNRQIAERLVLSVRTAEGHVERVRDKLGVQSRAQIAAWFVENR